MTAEFLRNWTTEKSDPVTFEKETKKKFLYVKCKIVKHEKKLKTLSFSRDICSTCLYNKKKSNKDYYVQGARLVRHIINIFELAERK